MTLAVGHTFGKACLACQVEEGAQKPPSCVHATYSGKLIRFVRVPDHLAALREADESSGSRASSAQVARLWREFVTLPPRHWCSCRCRWKRKGCPAWDAPKHNPDHAGCAGAPMPECLDCRKLRDAAPLAADIGVDVGRTSLVNAPMPSAVLLDVARALAVYPDGDAYTLAAWLNGEREDGEAGG